MHVQPIGFFFPQDAIGNVLNPTRQDLIPVHWRPLIEEVLDQYRQRLGEQLHSVWLRGSVARGTAVDGISDLDTFALIHGQDVIRWQSANWEREVGDQLAPRFPFVNQIEFQLNSRVADMGHEFPLISMIIATQSLCLWGDDIRSQLPVYRPGRQMCLYYRWIAQDVADFMKKESMSEADCRGLMKTFIRAGFELVMERQQRFTLDLFCCCQAFSEHYAYKSAEMCQALAYFITPPVDFYLLRKFVSELGTWLIEEVNFIFGKQTS
ncbi:MAG: hypothetical protein DHS20C18_10060 [Saprospiraceae bacterium]|nr:MAG: hypothetical protein DHS20C18_10060 [Saprospiraceae bacterium]